MRRGSVIGPLILIGLGVLFLFRNLWPEIPLVDLISRFWPFLLIAWGVIRLIEILFWAITEKPLPRNGDLGRRMDAGFHHLHRRRHHVHGAQRVRPGSPPATHGGASFCNMGESYDYTLAPVEKPCAKNCRIVIESFRGNAKITGSADAARSRPADRKPFAPSSNPTPTAPTSRRRSI